MKNQIFVAIGVALFTAVLVTGLASTIYAQSNMTGGNMTSATGATGDDNGGDGEDENGDGDSEEDDDDDEEGSN